MTSSCTSMASEVFQWNGADVSNEGKQEKIKEELADVVNYCVLMADACGLDLDEIVWEKIKVNAKKYPVEKAKDTVLEYIGCNRFSVETLDKIENEELKKLYFLYLTPSATIRVFSDCTEDTKRIISTFILEELPFMYSRIVETILSSKPGYKVIAGILENFGEKVCTDLLKKIDLFSGHDNDKLTMLIKANKSKRLVDFDFSLLQFIPYFHVSNLLSKQEEQIIMNSAYELKEAPIRKILLLHLDELKDVLIKTNGAQPGDTQIISVIEEQIKELYHQISIFEL